MNVLTTSRQSFNLEYANTYNYPCDFKLVVGDKEYDCYLHQLLNVSGTIQKLYKQNPQLKEYKIKSLKDPHHYFPLFIQLISGKPANITFENSFFFKILAAELEIPALEAHALENQKISVTNDNVCKILEIYDEYNCNYTNLVDYLATNWSFFSQKSPMRNLPLHILQEILKNEKFQATDELSVNNWIHDLVSKRGAEFRALYNTRHFEKLTAKEMRDVISDVSYDEINPTLWQSLTNRLVLPLRSDDEEDEEDVEEELGEEDTEEINDISSQQSNNVENEIENNQNQQPQTIQYTLQQPQQLATPTLSQIIQSQQAAAAAQQQQHHHSHLHSTAANVQTAYKYPAGTRFLEYSSKETQHLENAHKQLCGVVATLKYDYPDTWKTMIYVTGGGNKVNRILQIFNYEDVFNGWWDTYSGIGTGFQKKDAWLCVKFNNHRLEMTGYTLGSCARVRYSHQPRSWKVEASNDNENWVKVNEQKTQKMNVQQPLVYFPMNKTKAYSYFKWTMLENNTTQSMPNQYEFSVCALELFGILVPN